MKGIDVVFHTAAFNHDYDPKDIKTETIGSKPVEKLFEELMTSEETRRTIELKRYFSITPEFLSLCGSVFGCGIRVLLI